MTPNRPVDLDIVLWGATGYTGRLVAHYLAETQPASAGSDQSLSWALAGRSRAKLEALRAELAAARPEAPHLAELPLIVADALDPDSLEPMVRRARVVCTTVGPYSRYGTPLVRLCAEHGTDSCDLSGEVHWMRETVDRFHDRAAATGARIVHCCGFDSIPSDLGVLVTHDRLLREVGGEAGPDGPHLHRVRLRVGRTRGKMSGGTVASMFEIVGEARRDRAVRRVLLDPYALNPEGERQGPDRSESLRPSVDRDRNGPGGVWTGPFLMAGINTRIVRRSNALLGYRYGRELRYDERVDTGTGLAGRLRARMLSTALGAFTTGAALPPTAWALRRFLLPSPGEGPSAEERNRGYFRIALLAEGDTPDGEEPVALRTAVRADRDPGYGATARMLGESVLCLARGEAEGLDGGVLTPASALGLPLVARLRAAGITFDTERL